MLFKLNNWIINTLDADIFTYSTESTNDIHTYCSNTYSMTIDMVYTEVLCAEVVNT